MNQLVTSDELARHIDNLEHLPRWQGRKQEIEDRLRFSIIAARDEHIKEIRFTDPTNDLGYFASFDVWLFSASSWYFAEIKMRSSNSDRYPSWMIEESKAKELEKLTEMTGKKSLLVTICPDRTMVWDISSKHERKELQCPASTMYDQRKKAKQVRLYPTSTASTI